MDYKKQVGLEAATRVKHGMIVGLGTGSTATHFVRELGRRIKEEKLAITAVSSSLACSLLAHSEGVPLVPVDQIDHVDLYVDGADEVSPEKGLIKGRGAAMVGEKLLAEACSSFVVIVDEGKLVNRLGTKFPLPVEVLPTAWRLVHKGIVALGGNPVLRMAQGGKDGPVVSDNGNLILDVTFPQLAATGTASATAVGADPDWFFLDSALDSLPGVVGHGLFLRYIPKTTVLVGSTGGVRVLA